MTTILKVDWVDSKVSDLHQVEDEDVPLPCHITSIGFQVKRTDDYVVIAREQIDEDWRGVLTIPTCCITNIVELPEKPS